MKTLHNARWLAGREVKRSRNAYLWMVIISLAAGLGAAVLYNVTFRANGPAGWSPSALLLDFLFLIGLSTLPRLGAWISNNRDMSALDDHLIFLRRLPLTVRELIAGRILTISLSATVVSVALLLLPYLLSQPFRAQLGASGYLLFVAFWVGYALVMESVGLFTELGLGGRTGVFIYTTLLALIGSFVGYSAGAEVSVLGRVIELIQTYGFLPGPATLLLGVLALTLSSWATTRLLNRRDLTK